MSQNGQMLKEDWTVIVPQSASTNNLYDNTRPTVSVNNLQSGATVPPVFNIQGQTQPYAKIKIDASSQRSLIPGIVGIQGRSMETRTVADAQGRFDVQLDTSNLPSDSRLDIQVSVLGDQASVTAQRKKAAGPRFEPAAFAFCLKKVTT